MAITQYYVDPSINANSGTGTIGDPFGDLQYALDTVTRDSTNGDQFNIKSGTAEVLTAQLSLVSYGGGSTNAPLAFSGYTSSANDGGIGVLDGNGLYKIISAPNYCHLKDLELRNSGTAGQIASGSVEYGSFANCTFHGVSGGTYGVYGLRCIGCHFYDIGGTYATGNCNLHGCGLFQGPTNVATHMVLVTQRRTISGCVFYDQSSSGSGSIITGNNQNTFQIFGNSIICDDNVGINITGQNAGGLVSCNLIEGASTAINTNQSCSVTANAVYNSSVADYSIKNSVFDNESLSASPFEKTGAATWANAKAYFAPADVGNVRTGAYSSIDGAKGAIGVQAAAGGGGAVLHPLRSN